MRKIQPTLYIIVEPALLVLAERTAKELRQDFI